MRMASVPFGAVACLFLFAAGCGDSTPSGSTSTGAGGSGGGTATTAGAGGSTATTTGAGGGTATSSGTGGSGACTLATGTCGAPDLCGPITPAVQVMADMPSALGGTLEDGTYWLTDTTVYSGVGSPSENLTAAFGATYVFAAGKFQAIGVRVKKPGANPDQGESSGTFSVAMNQVTLDATCGNPGGTMVKYNYTVSGKELTLYSTIDGVASKLIKQ